MNSLNDLPKISPETIDTMINGYKVSQILLTAVENDVFTMLSKSESKSAKEFAEEMKMDYYATEKFLNALVALGLLVKSDKKYYNTVLVETFLVKEMPFYLGNLVKMSPGGYQAFSKLDEILKTGEPLQKSDDEYIFDEIFILGHAEAAICGDLPGIVDTLQDIPEFVNARKLLDFGGGHGLHSIAFAKKNPKLEAIVFDFPNVVEIAKKFIIQHGMEDRIKLMAGDFTKDDIGNGYDLVFVSHVFYQKEGVLPCLGKIYDVLKEDGTVILNHWIANNNRTAPQTSVLFDLLLSLTLRDSHVFTVNEYTHLLEEAGFSKVRILDIQTSSSPSMLIKGNKEV